MAASVTPPFTTRTFVPPSPPKTPKSADTRQRLIELAARLFVEQGYAAVSMRDIASAARLTTGAVYGHFRSKGQLLVEVIRWKITESDRQVDYAEVGASLERGAELMHDDYNRDTRLLELDAAAAARHDSEIADGLRSVYVERHTQICAAMSELADPDAAAWVVTALTAGLGMWESTGPPRPAASRLTATILAMLEGLAAQG